MRLDLFQHTQTTQKPKPPLLFRMATGIVTISMMLSCSLFQPGGSTSGGKIKVGDVEVNTNPTLGDLSQAEQEMRNTLREPLREVLGADADAMFKESDAAYDALYRHIQQNLDGQSSRPPGHAQFEIFGLVFGDILAGQNLMAESGKDKHHDKGKKDFGENVNIEYEINYTRSGSKLTADVNATLTAGKGDKKLVESAKGKYDIEICPDANGHSMVNFDLSFDTRASGDGNSAGAQGSIKGSGNGLVNDNAELTGLDMDITSSVATQKSSSETGGQIKGEYAEVHSAFGFNDVFDEDKRSVTHESSNITRQSSQATKATADAATTLGAKLGTMFASAALSMAQDLWQNGYCVEIQVDGAQDSNQLKPSDSDAFTAKVHHKFEGEDIKAPITGTLSGEKSLKPLEKKNSPVDYTYQSPPEKDKEATITLETRSKRGAAKKTISYKTVEESYTVSGSIDEFLFSGVICDPAKPFTIQGQGGGGSATYNLTPGSGSEGLYEYKGSGPEGMTLSGNGPYRIIPGANGYGKLELSGKGCVESPQGSFCSDSTDQLDLSPLQDSSSCGK